MLQVERVLNGLFLKKARVKKNAMTLEASGCNIML